MSLAALHGCTAAKHRFKDRRHGKKIYNSITLESETCGAAEQALMRVDRLDHEHDQQNRVFRNLKFWLRLSVFSSTNDTRPPGPIVQLSLLSYLLVPTQDEHNRNLYSEQVVFH